MKKGNEIHQKVYPGDDFELIERKSDGMFNFLRPDGSMVSDVWFATADKFCNGLAAVQIVPEQITETATYNYLKPNGSYLFEQFVEYANTFNCGYGLVRVKKNDKNQYNFVDRTGNFIRDNGFDFAHDFSCNFAVVYEDDRGMNYIKQDASFLLSTWEYICHDFCEDCGMIEKRFNEGQKNHKQFAFVNSKGDILGNNWFADANSFNEGFAVVRRLPDGLYNYLLTDGTFLLDEWMFYADDFNEGFGIIGIKPNAYDFVTKSGTRLLKKWMFDVTTFSNGRALVYPDDKYSFFAIDEYGMNVTD